MTNQEIKNSALATLEGNWTQPVLATLVITAISLCSSILGPLQPIVTLLVVVPVQFGLYVALYQMTKDKTANDTVSRTFNIAFGNYGRSLGVSLLIGLFTALWCLLLFIPGIIKSYAYAMTYYIANDCPELSANECIDKSIEMMRGHKMDLFLLDLSFIGWIILCLLSCGIGFLWLIPYECTARADFYNKIKG
ncbi:MAG: DUF975 family protein [Salinivirgaceae bacterium]|nr:DUF975 family protein [Salinivirgaceae bacterium]